MLPEWYLSADIEPETEVQPAKTHRRADPVRRALASLGEIMALELTSPAQEACWLGRLEPRAKIVGMLILIFGATVLHGIGVLGVLLALTLILGLTSRLPAKRLARLWLGVPLFGLALILPAVLNLVTPGDPVLTLWRFASGARFGPWALPPSVSVTHSGLVVAGRFLLRTLSCVTLSFLLVFSTRPAVLLCALRRLGMPRVFGMILAMTHRYMALLLRAAEEIHLAKLSRTIAASSIRREQSWVAAGMGILFRRSYRLAQEVQQAMVSRGYDGDLQVRASAQMGVWDYIWLIGSVAAMALLYAGDKWL